MSLYNSIEAVNFPAGTIFQSYNQNNQDIKDYPEAGAAVIVTNNGQLINADFGSVFGFADPSSYLYCILKRGGGPYNHSQVKTFEEGTFYIAINKTATSNKEYVGTVVKLQSGALVALNPGGFAKWSDVETQYHYLGYLDSSFISN